ncbi:MAG: DUF4388 domain-containing protein [Myxococcales bacterium]|nr:DUF4388 domain-containing protein [Myxococcales bacterium]MCB9542991.1 DUF4388 domain-containing protein [Myxococcales bacterium]MCB9551792.1 DUF4388 domain-containing protein [Myxococcales bacterium]
MALQGSLADFGIAEILQLIGSQQKTGILHVTGGESGEEVMISFSSGRIIRTDVNNRHKRDLLGQMLIAAGEIDKEQLGAALKSQKKSLKRLGDVLVEDGTVRREAINQLADLQARETLYRLFEWKSGQYRFESKPPNFTRPSGTAISSESLLMEGFRMLDEWPLIRARINNYSVVYRQTDKARTIGDESQALERILDDAFVEASMGGGGGDGLDDGFDFDESLSGSGGLGDTERAVLALVDGQRDVHQIVDRSRLGEFETSKALLTLLNEEYIEPTKVKKALDAPSRRPGVAWRQLAVRLVVNATLLGLIVVGVLFMPRSRIQLHRNTERVAGEALDRLRANRLVAIGNALEVYRVENGAYPDTLAALTEARLIEPAALDLPGEAPISYISIGTDYDLR